MDYIQHIRKKIGHDLLIMPSVTIIHFDDRDRILLLKHATAKFWVAPGGSIEPNETAADAAVREMWEETGLYVKLTRILGVFGGPEFLVSYPSGDQTTYIITVFESELIRGELKQSEEALQFAYVSEHELSELELSSWARVVIPQLFSVRQRPAFQPPTWQP